MINPPVRSTEGQNSSQQEVEILVGLELSFVEASNVLLMH